MTFAIAMGVRKGETRLKARIDQILQAEQPAIRQILADYAIPTIAEQPPERSSVQR
jgi:hypothetical protein